MHSKERQEEKVLYWFAASVVVVGAAYATHGGLGVTWQGEPPHRTKPYGKLSQFYPFYLEEHNDPVSRVLHVFGSTLVILLAISGQYRPQLPNLIIGASVGSMLCEYLSPLPNGLIEFAAMLGTVGALSLVRNQRVPWKLAVTGYFFAWVGHYFFEHNRPATFIYPSYSLMCDFVMWFETITGKLPLNERNDTKKSIETVFDSVTRCSAPK